MRRIAASRSKSRTGAKGLCDQWSVIRLTIGADMSGKPRLPAQAGAGADPFKRESHAAERLGAQCRIRARRQPP
jgi:hypothetical protein